MIALAPTSSMLCVGDNIDTHQWNVTRTKLGFNVPKTKHVHDIGDLSTTTTLLAKKQFPRPSASFESRYRHYVAKKHS